MLKRSLLIAAAIGIGTSSAQAAHQWDDYGSARFTTKMDREVESADFRGPVDRIRLTARGSGVVCRRVVAVFGNNKRRRIFSGRIRRGQSRTVDLPGNERRVDRVVLVCRATERGRDRARLKVEGRTEVAALRQGRRGRYNWERLGSVAVDSRFDRDVKVTREFEAMDRLRLTTRRSGVVCQRIVAEFGNGQRRKVFSGRIRRNQRKIVDLPGNDRNVKRLIFACRATQRGHHQGRLLVDGRIDLRRGRRGNATVCCRKLFIEWTTTAQQCRRYDGEIQPPRNCR